MESSLILKVEPFRTYSDVTKGWAGLEGANPDSFQGKRLMGWLHIVKNYNTGRRGRGWLINNGRRLQYYFATSGREVA